MLEMKTTVYMTSNDALELAKLLREKELNCKWGDDLTVKEWTCDSPDSMTIKVDFVVDQERARKHGLMK